MITATSFRAGSILLTTVSFLSCSGTSDGTLWERANRIHEQAVVIDAHAHPKPGGAETMSLGEKTGAFELDFITMKEGGLDAVFFSVPLLRSESPGRPESVLILEDAGAVTDEVERFADLAEIAYSPEDILRIHDLGKRAVLLGVEAGDPFGGDVGTVEQYFDSGIRMVTLAAEHVTTPDPGISDRSDLPLNDFGKRVIEEMTV